MTESSLPFKSVGRLLFMSKLFRKEAESRLEVILFVLKLISDSSERSGLREGGWKEKVLPSLTKGSKFETGTCPQGNGGQ